jgi:hypothetical protein
MKQIKIIDADLIGRKNHRFPNLACMKISGYHKSLNDDVELIVNYEQIIKDNYDKIYISKVFTDTEIPNWILEFPNVEWGGTGFNYDEADPLPNEIEHHMPDYHLYDNWISEMIDDGHKRNEFEYYLDYSIGFTTRGCFRKCSFCVNKKYDKVVFHSPIDEFLDVDRKYICLLDDNILGYYDWENIINKLIKTNKPFQYKQGMDIRLMTDKKAEKLSKCKYRGDYIFAFDNYDDKELIEEKIKIWRKYTSKSTKFYILCAYDEYEVYDENFWITDIINIFKRIFILAKYDCKPYIMRFNKFQESPYKGMYINLASWGESTKYIKKDVIQTILNRKRNEI